MNARHIAVVALAYTFLLVSNALGQWEWVGGPLLSSYTYLTAAAGRVMVSGYYAGDPSILSSDYGGSWYTTPSLKGNWLTRAVASISGSDTVLLALSYGRIVRSTDVGYTWVLSDTGVGLSDISALSVGPSTAEVPGGVLIAGSGSAGVFRSVDRGLHWSGAATGPTSPAIKSVATAGTVCFAATNGGGVFRSTDNGISWSSASAGIPDTSITLLASAGGSVYASSGPRVYRSTDIGGSWTLADASPLKANVSALGAIASPGQGLGVAVVVMCDSGMYRKWKGGETWEVIGPPLVQTPSVTGLRFAVDDTFIYYMNTSKIFRSSDAGTSWVRIGVRTGSGAFWVGPPSPTGVQDIFAAAAGGIITSDDHGSSWHGVFSDSAGHSMSAIDVAYDTAGHKALRILAGTEMGFGGGLYRSNDGGASWSRLQLTSSRTGAVADLGSTLMAAWNDVSSGFYLRSTDGGSTWSDPPASMTARSVFDLKVFPKKNGDRVIYAAGYFSLFRSTDDGETWLNDSLLVPGSGRKYFSQVDGDYYVATGGTIRKNYNDDGSITEIRDSAKVYRSTDEGVSWHNVSGDLSAWIIRGFVAAAPAAHPGHLYLAACSDEAVYTSDDGGKHWSVATDNIPVIGTAGKMAADEEYLYLSLNGVYRRPWGKIPVSSVGERSAEIPLALRLDQNYPNPFNPTTTMQYTINDRQSTSIKVFDLLGREVATLVNEVKGPGRYSVTWNAAGFASGMYFCRLQAGGSSQTTKLVLTR
jgi:photosystem II stability/assembly factor-like uncharacterized protein